MRRMILLLASTVAVPPVAQAAAADEAPYVAFDRQVQDAKKAMMGDPATALSAADRALAAAQALPASPRAMLAVATAQWLDGEAYIGLNQVDKASPLVASALSSVERVSPDSKLHGDLLRSRGAIAATQGRVLEALAAFQQAYRVFTAAGEVRSQAIALQDIAQIYESAGDYEQALSKYAQANETYDRDPALLLANDNNRGEVLRKLRRLPEAEQQYQAALREARLLGSVVLEVRILCNLATVQAERGEVASAQAAVDRAAGLARSGEAAGWHPFVLGTAAKVAMAGGDFRRAGTLFDQMFAGVNLGTTDMPYREFHQDASTVYQKLGRPDLALAHLQAFKRLDDGARELIASTSAQLTSAKFDFANQNLKISKLRTSQLQQQVELERQHGRMRTLILGSILAVAAIIFGFLAFALVTGRRSRDRLRAVNTDLARALKAKTDFLAMTSHEIRTPLNGILGMTQVMLSERDLSRDVRDRLSLVHGAGETMKSLVDDILDVAKMETDTVVLSEQDVDIERLIRDVVGLWEDQARAKGLTITCDLAGLPARVRTDQARLRQILFNLLSNAVKFTGSGRVAVSATTRTTDRGDIMSVKVADTGIGIDASQHAKIFEPFHQADASTTRQYGGTGLGLAISRKLTLAMGGTLSVDSSLGSGAVFALDLPLKRGMEAGPSHTVQTRPASLAATRLALLDDNPLRLGTLGGLLEPHVAAFTGAETIADALSLVEAGAVDHLLLNLSACGEDSATPLSTVTGVIDAATSRHVGVTIMATADCLDRINHFAAIDVRILTKPIGANGLIAALREVCDQTESPVRTAA